MVGLERTLKITELQPPAMGLLPPHPDSGCPGLHAWPWAPSGMGQQYQGLIAHCVQNFSLTFNLNLPSSSLKLLPLVLSLSDCVKTKSLSCS